MEVEEGNGKMVGPSSVRQNPTSRAKEKASRELRTRLFPREEGEASAIQLTVELLDML